MLRPDEQDDINQKRYEKDYSLEQVSINKNLNKEDYFHKLTEIKLSLVKEYGQAKKVLDVGCGSGDYLLSLHELFSSALGIDYVSKAIDEANLKKNKKDIKNIDFVCANARKMSLPNESFDLAFSFSALFHMPQVENIVEEISRVLKHNGIAILEMGNVWSLNTLVCRAYPQWARPFHISVGTMSKIVRQSNLKIVCWRSFQILPFWGDQPWWLKPFLHHRWKQMLSRDWKGKMIDERISSFPIMNQLAFRHIIVCRKW